MAAETEDRGTSTVFDGVKGHQLADGTWVYSGTNNIVAVKDQTYYQTLHGDTGSQELFTEKTDWVRLREISITYKLGDLVLGKQTFFKDVQIYVSGKNLLLSTPYKGIDPETNLFGANNAQGLDYFNMPNTKSVIVGLKIKI